MNWIDSNIVETENNFRSILNKNPLENFKENLFKQFQVDLKSEIKTQFYYLKYANLQPSEVVNFYYWEWQMMIEEMKEYIEKEKEEQEKSKGEHSYKNTSEYKQASNTMRSYGIDPSGHPTGGGFRMPSSSPGNIKIPKI